MTSLNALAEHVAQKVKALENQKHTVEHAVVEANRLNEMVWAMEVQINKLNEGARQATRTEELIDRVEKLASRSRRTARRRASRPGTRSRRTWHSSTRIASALTDFVRGYIDKLAIERKEFEAFDQRVKALQIVRDRGGEGDGGARRPRSPGGRRWRSGSISCRSRCRRSTPTPTTCSGSRRRSTGCRSRSRRWTSSPSAPPGSTTTSSRAGRTSTSLRQEIQDFYKSHAAAVQLRDRLAADRASLEVVPRANDLVQRRAAGARRADGRDHQQARHRGRGHAEGREPRRRSPTISIAR